MSLVSITNISKKFKNLSAVHDVNLDIGAGEFFSILGPSGCGKTTLLRMIAGFEQPTSGDIFIGGEMMTNVRPQHRGVGMVFQNYALFPHMTVFENVAFGLETQRISKPQIEKRVARILDAVHLTDKVRTPVPQLSGGEQQRVAVARALVVEPKVLLMDEPLSNLDVALRLKTREEIRTLQRALRITTIYVTHDQSEAMSLSDRIAVMRLGGLEQIGTPSEMYDAPSSPFVAEFLGGANVLAGTLDVAECKLYIRGCPIDVPSSLIANHLNGAATLAVKPEAVILHPHLQKGEYEATILHKEYLGFTTNFVVKCGGVVLRSTMMSSGVTKQLTPGESVGVTFDWSRCTLLPEAKR